MLLIRNTIRLYFYTKKDDLVQQVFKRMKNEFWGLSNIIFVISRLRVTFDFEDSFNDKITNSFQVKI